MPLPELASAVDRRVVRTLVCFQVEVGYSGTICKILIDVIHCIKLHTSGERSHLSLFTLVPDDTLYETLTGADGIEVDLSGRGLKLHLGLVAYVLIIVPTGAESDAEWTVAQPSFIKESRSTLEPKL